MKHLNGIRENVKINYFRMAIILPGNIHYFIKEREDYEKIRILSADECLAVLE